ncbi:MAG: restriction endonuclease subunit S [Phaeodactylibacter sp.]|nr:restriction endonuclease subunit S [Phaeodactylibacter sp.]
MALKKDTENMPQNASSETPEQRAQSLKDSSKAGLSAEASAKAALPAVDLSKAGYKKTPLWWLPVEWEVVKIADVATVGNGTTPSRKNKEYWENGQIPWLPTGKVNDIEIEFADEFITEKALEETSLKLLPVHTVLVGMIGQGKTRGMSAITKLEATVNQNFAYIVSKEKLVPLC